MKDTPAAFCRMVSTNPDISNAAARFGAWLVGAASQTGGFPIDLTVHQIRSGFTRNGVTVPGTGARYETIRAACEWLESRGHLITDEGRPVGFGFTSRNYTITL